MEKWCWNLLYNVERLRKDHLEVEVFARFLEVTTELTLSPPRTHTTCPYLDFDFDFDLSSSHTSTQEYYDADDLLFFLYVRFTIQNQLHINFRSRWTELAHGPERQPRTIFLSHRECQLVQINHAAPP